MKHVNMTKTLRAMLLRTGAPDSEVDRYHFQQSKIVVDDNVITITSERQKPAGKGYQQQPAPAVTTIDPDTPVHEIVAVLPLLLGGLASEKCVDLIAALCSALVTCDRWPQDPDTAQIAGFDDMITKAKSLGIDVSGVIMPDEMLKRAIEEYDKGTAVDPNADTEPYLAKGTVSLPLEQVELPTVIRNTLAEAGYTELSSLIGKTAEEIDALPIDGLGPKRAQQIVESIVDCLERRDANINDKGPDPDIDGGAPGDAEPDREPADGGKA